MFSQPTTQNKYMFGYLSHLVEQGEMNEIDVGFLVVGHTHCSIDQYFSTLSTFIKKQDFIPTPDAMRHLLTIAHPTKRPDKEFVQSLDVRVLYSPKATCSCACLLDVR
jgi:hypothetical protein